MKNLIKSLILAVALVCLTANAQNTVTITNVVTITNTVTTLNVTSNAPIVEKLYGKWELTINGAGSVVPKTGSSQFGLSLSLATDPFKKAPNVWVGMVQGLSWEPTFAGSTDVYSEYAWHIYKDLWLNTGWSVGTLYDTQSSLVWRTGPQVEVEYYIGSNTFLVSTINYDLMTRGNSGLRYSFGVGVTF